MPSLSLIPDNGLKSKILLSDKSSTSKLIKFANTLILLILLDDNVRVLSFFKSANGYRCSILFPSNFKVSRFVKFDSKLISLTLY